MDVSNHPDLTSKRPASLKWALVVFGFLGAVSVLMAFQHLGDALTPVLAVLCVASFLALLVRPRHRRTHLLASVVLGLVLLRALYVAWVFCWSATTPSVSAIPAAEMLVACALLGWLFYAYTFGQATRRFYSAIVTLAA